MEQISWGRMMLQSVCVRTSVGLVLGGLAIVFGLSFFECFSFCMLQHLTHAIPRFLKKSESESNLVLILIFIKETEPSQNQNPYSKTSQNQIRVGWA